MRKLALIIVLLLVSLGASAQIKNVKITEKIETIARFRTMTCSLCHHLGLYYVSLTSTSSVDDSFLFVLGDTRESSVQTLVDLESLVNRMEEGETATFDIEVKGTDKGYKIYKNGKTSIWFSSDGYAGYMVYTISEMDLCIDKLCYKAQ